MHSLVIRQNAVRFSGLALRWKILSLPSTKSKNKTEVPVKSWCQSLCFLFSHEEVIADASSEVKLFSDWGIHSWGVSLTQRIFFYQVWNRKCVFHCPLTRTNVKVDDIHWMKLGLAEWVFMMLQETCQSHVVLHFLECWKAHIYFPAARYSLSYSTEGTLYGTRHNKTRKFAPSLSQNYTTWCTSRRTISMY